MVIGLAGKDSKKRSIAYTPVMLSRCLTLPMNRSRSRMVSRRVLNRRDFALAVWLVLTRLGKRAISHPQLRVPDGIGGRLIILDRAALNVLRG